MMPHVFTVNTGQPTLPMPHAAIAQPEATGNPPFTTFQAFDAPAAAPIEPLQFTSAPVTVSVTPAPENPTPETTMVPPSVEAPSSSAPPSATPSMTAPQEAAAQPGAVPYGMMMQAGQPFLVHATSTASIANSQDGSTEQPSIPTDLRHLIWPSIGDLGMRVRKIIALFMRQQRSAQTEIYKRQQLIEKQRAKLELQQEKAKAKEKDFTKKDKQDFTRVLMSYGVEYDPEDLEKRVWTRFKELAFLKKSDEVLDEYYTKIFDLCKEVVEKGDIARKEHGEKDDAGETEVGDKNLKFNPYSFKIERDGEVMAYDKAKRLLRRIELLRMLREQVLPHPELEERLSTSKKYQGTQFPA